MSDAVKDAPAEAGTPSDDQDTVAPAGPGPPAGDQDTAKEPPLEGSTRRPEARWPIVVAVVAAGALYASLQAKLILGPPWLVPLVETILLVPLLVTEPHWHKDRGWNWQRVLSIALVGAINVANLVSLMLLINLLLTGRKEDGLGAQVIGEAMKVWLCNTLVFALWYWEFDRGGPRSRHWEAGKRTPDFLFPQMTTPRIAPPHWMPTFVDYFYVSFTNSTAFSPTDTLPLTPWAKMLMLVQSLISLLTVALVAARAVNILS